MPPRCARHRNTCPSSAASSATRSRSNARRETERHGRCRTGMQARWLALVLIASAAHAEPRLRFRTANRHGTMERATVSTGGGTATISSRLAAKSRDRSEAEVGIDLPAGSRVVGLVMHGGGLRMDGRRVDADEGNAKYRAELERKIDPALL